MPGFLKTYAKQAVAQEAYRRSAALRAQSVPTPAARARPTLNEIEFDRIEGTTGRDLIGDDMGPLLRSLDVLHRANLSALPLYDPLLRVRPRLVTTDVEDFHAIVNEPLPTGTATVHGDLHVGQFIREASGAVWIVDLDDLAVGPAEADLANFAAHLATTVPEHSIATWSEKVCRLWAGLGQSIDRVIFERCLRFSLLRRHLKLREVGRPDFKTEILAYLRDRANFSIL